MEGTRKVSIVTTKGQNRVGANSISITDEIKTLGQLYPILSEYRVEYQGMKIMLVEGNFTLEHEDAVLPTGDFWLSLTPVKTKAGASYAEMKAFIKERRAVAVSSKDADTVELIGDYTRMTKAQMEELYDELQDLAEVEEEEEDDTFEDVAESNDLVAEVARLKTKVNRLIDEYDLDDETYEDLDEECEVRQASVVVPDVIPDEVKRLQEWALRNR